MRVCAIIPSHNHYQQLDKIIKCLQKENLFVFVIDDGSNEPARSALALLNDASQNVLVHRLDTNLGKGGAVVAGMSLAISAGFTHALQIDADGQHDLSVLSEFLVLSEQYPETIICGCSLYDSSAPLTRRIGRWITHIWVWIETLSFRIADSMCGFRIYPLAAVQSLIEQEKIGRRMDFDTDILVRLFWCGVAPIMRPVRVIYPPENTSNFDLVEDNWRIIKMHTRLVLTLLWRLPKILSHRPPSIEETRRWSLLSERGVYWGMKLCSFLCRGLGRRGRRIFLAPIVLYFYITGSVQRQASRQYLMSVLHRTSTWREGYKHFMNFGLCALDVVMAWMGELPFDAVDSDSLLAPSTLFKNKRGSLIVVSHFGSSEIMRALVDKSIRSRITVLVHTHHAAKYNRIVSEGSLEASANIFQVTEIGPETIIDLKQRIDQGEWIVIAGDRVPVLSKNNTVSAPFLGKEAVFPQGPWILAALLGCPVFLLFCILEEGRYRLTMERFAERVFLHREDRQKSAREYVRRYAKRLEHYCSIAPFQWYNFFDFWSQK